MQIIAKLTTEQRRDLEELLAHMDGLLEKETTLTTQYRELESKLGSLRSALPDLEARADAGDLDASRDILATRDQIERATRSMAATERQLVPTLRDSMNLAAQRALAEIKELVQPQIAPLKKRLLKMLAPYFHHEHVASAAIENLDCLVEIRATSKRVTPPYQDFDSARAQFTTYRGKLQSILQDGIVWEFQGFDTAEAA